MAVDSPALAPSPAIAFTQRETTRRAPARDEREQMLAIATAAKDTVQKARAILDPLVTDAFTVENTCSLIANLPDDARNFAPRSQVIRRFYTNLEFLAERLARTEKKFDELVITPLTTHPERYSDTQISLALEGISRFAKKYEESCAALNASGFFSYLSELGTTANTMHDFQKRNHLNALAEHFAEGKAQLIAINNDPKGIPSWLAQIDAMKTARHACATIGQ